MRSDLAHRDRDTLHRHHLAIAFKHVSVRIETFRVLAHDQHVEARPRMGHAGMRARGAQVGVEIEIVAELAWYVDATVLRHRITTIVAWPEKDAIGLDSGLVDAIGERGAMRLQAC